VETTERITNLMREQYQRLDEEKQGAISMAYLASTVYAILDRTGGVPLEIRFLLMLAQK
jgi:hypothetical protein